MLAQPPSNASTALPALGSRSLGARGESLQSFQARITQRIAQAQAQPDQEQARLHLMMGSLNVLVPLLEVGELMPVPAFSPIPMASPWMLGLAVVRGEVLLALDVAFFVQEALNALGLAQNTLRSALPPARDSSKKLIVVSPAVAPRLSFVASSIEGTVYLDRDQIQPFYAVGLPQMAHPYIKQFWKSAKGELMIELSLSALLQSNAVQSTTPPHSS